MNEKLSVNAYWTNGTFVTHLLIHTAKVLKNIVHAAFFQHFTRMGFSKAVNPHTVHLIHLTLHKATTGLSNSHNIQQIGCSQ